MITQLNIFFRVCLLSLIVGLPVPVVAGTSLAETSTDLPDGIVGAVCVVRHDNKMVMLTEVITKKISLPGGYIDTGDSARQAAVREALEETGIVVKVEDLLQFRGRAAIFSCVAESPILVSSFRDHTGHPIVASWFSKHFSTEVQRVYLIDPDEVDPKDYRYSDDAALLGDWLARTPESQIHIYTDLSEQVSSLHQYELKLIQTFQQTIKALPATFQSIFEGAMYAANLPGEPVVIALVVVAVAGLCSPRVLLQLVLILLLAIFTTSLLKLLVASPRPSYIIPELQQVNAYGYGFPSTHTFLATILWGICWYKLCQRFDGALKWLSLPIFILLIVGQGVSRVWYGVHFFTDTIASILLGLAVMMGVMTWFVSTHTSLLDSTGNKWLWLLFTIVAGVTASFTHSPVHVYIFAILLGIVFGMEMLPDRAAYLTFPRRLIVMVVIAAGLAVISYGTGQIADQLTVSLIVLAIRALGCFLAAIWLVAGTSFFHQRLAIRHRN